MKNLILIFAIIMMTACSGNEPIEQKDNLDKSPIEDKVKKMNADEIAAIEEDDQRKDEQIVIDVRTPGEYFSGHLKHAINIPLQDIERDVSVISDLKDDKLVLYCNTGNRSSKAADILKAEGFKDIIEAPGVKQVKYELYKYNNIMAKDLLEANREHDIFLIDARRAEDFKEGHLKDAINIIPEDLENNLELIPKDRDIYAYCYTGSLSSQIMERLSEMGYDRLYNCIEGTDEYEYEFEK
ncbi:MAG: rhodanese-like domain-containing protein [Tissierellia bacterium]|nr:rhodanese-like domain-containing protein [Tissierellia bacterium]